MPREPVIQEPLIPARTRPVTASPRLARSADVAPRRDDAPLPLAAPRDGPARPLARRNRGDAVPGALPSYYEYLAPSRWKDAKLDESARLASASRLHEDALRRQKLRREAETAKPPVTRWSGRRVPKETVDADAAHREPGGRAHQQAQVHVRRPGAAPDGHDPVPGPPRGLRGCLSPTKKLPVVDRARVC